MSIKYILQAMETNVGSPTRKLVLIKLADNANDKGECYPSYQHIADHCEMSRRSVMRHVEQLVEDGLITVENRVTKYGSSSNVYRLITDLEIVNTQGDILTPPSDTVSPPSDILSLPPSDILSPRTCHSFKPVNEPKVTFDEFYSSYPKKVAKQDAIKAWKKLDEDEKILALEGVDGFVRGKEIKYVNAPSVYLNGKRWEDEPQLGQANSMYEGVI